jgi:hypothetical protein
MDVKVSLPEIEPMLAMPPQAETGIGYVESVTAETNDGSLDELLGSHDDDTDEPFGTIVVGEAEDDNNDGPSIVDPSDDELWAGTEAIKLEIPQIPALDLDWGELDDDDDDEGTRH